MNAMGVYMLCWTEKKGVLVPTMPGDATMQDSFLSMNPFHAIPTIKDTDSEGEFCLAESSAILRYLALKYAPQLYPQGDPMRRGFINWAMDRFSLGMMGDVYATIYPLLGFMAAPADQGAAGKHASEHLQEFADFFLREKFIGGNQLSIADYKVAPFFYAWEHPRTSEESKVRCPERIKQFNFDFDKECIGASLLAMCDGGSIKQALDKGGKPSDALAGGGDECLSKIQANNLLTKARDGKVKILGVPASKNCMGPILFAMEAQIGEMEQCMPGTDTQKLEFLEINPFHSVPTMKDGGFSLAESNAILRYLAEAYAPKFYPAEPKVRAKIDWAMDRFSSVMAGDAFKTLYVCFGYADPPEKDDDLWEAAKMAIKNMEEFADSFLKMTFIGGDSLCIADFKVAPFFFAYGHNYVKERCKLDIPDRIKKFNESFASTCKSSSMLSQAGGYSLQEWLDKKHTAKPDNQQDVAMEKGMQDQVSEQVEDRPPAELDEVVEKDNRNNCNWCSA